MGNFPPSLCVSSRIYNTRKGRLLNCLLLALGENSAVSREQITWFTEGLGEHVALMTALETDREVLSRVSAPQASHAHTF